jgi:ABC-type phosphate transport system substrate-binding protein
MKTFLLLLLLVMFTPSAQAELVIIVHEKNKIDSLTAQQVQNIFLGRSRIFPNGKFALPIDQSSPLRAEFYEKLSGRPVEQINAYWARIMFTGQASPPQQLPDDKAVLQTVRENEGAIGYIDSKQVDKTIHVVLRLN